MGLGSIARGDVCNGGYGSPAPGTARALALAAAGQPEAAVDWQRRLALSLERVEQAVALAVAAFASAHCLEEVPAGSVADHPAVHCGAVAPAPHSPVDWAASPVADLAPHSVPVQAAQGSAAPAWARQIEQTDVLPGQAAALPGFARAEAARGAAAVEERGHAVADAWHQGQADGLYRRRRAVDWLNSPPPPRIHPRRTPVTHSFQGQPQKPLRSATGDPSARMVADFQRAAHDFSAAFGRCCPTRGNETEIW